MPQTVEHLNILSLLGVRRGVVVLTKCDLADADWLAMARAELAARVKGTFLENAPVIETSAATGQGIEDLREMLHALVRQTREKSARVPFRLPIDRVFSSRARCTLAARPSCCPPARAAACAICRSTGKIRRSPSPVSAWR